VTQVLVDVVVMTVRQCSSIHAVSCATLDGPSSQTIDSALSPATTKSIYNSLSKHYLFSYSANYLLQRILCIKKICLLKCSLAILCRNQNFLLGASTQSNEHSKQENFLSIFDIFVPFALTRFFPIMHRY